MVLSIPWIIVALIAYNVLVFFLSGSPQSNPAETFDQVLFTLPMLSNSEWRFTLGDLVLLIALIALFVEVLKATRTRPLAILDHGLSVLVFIICLVEFLLVPEATTSLFFFITLIALIDVVAGFSVGIRAARRDFSFGGDMH